MAQEILARVARVPDEARAVVRCGLGNAALRGDACAVVHVPAGLAAQPRVAHDVGPIQLVSDVLQQCEALMLQGRVQFLLCHCARAGAGAARPGGLRSVRVGTDTLVPVSAPDKAGRPRHVLSSSGKTRVPILAYSSESGIGRVIRALRSVALENAHGEPVFTAHLASVLKTMALDGRGVAWLPTSLIEDELESGRLVEAGSSEWKIDVEIRLFRSDATLPPAAEAFWRAVSDPSA